ncbi:uncharacterized protein [Musca autumnalis]|uniref:uncharacterized protein n=1 Tax=Musca autumnalis TaxID=221902 RepID=UPI003CEB2504
MRTLVILFAVVTSCYGFEVRCLDSYLATVFEECTFEHGGNEAFTSNWAALKEATDDNEKCFRACVFRKCDFFDEEWKMKPDVPLGLGLVLSAGIKVKAPAIIKAAHTCRGLMEYENNICENSENWSRCMVKQCEHCGLELTLY